LFLGVDFFETAVLVLALGRVTFFTAAFFVAFLWGVGWGEAVFLAVAFLAAA
jgi:hypothetical protein